MDIQRLRSLTTGLLHTEMDHIHEDLEFVTDAPGIMTHMIPRAMQAVEPWLREKVTDARFWDGQLDPSHEGDYPLEPMTPEEQAAMFERFGALPNPLADRDVVVVKA